MLIFKKFKDIRAAPSQRLTGVWVCLRVVRAASSQWLQMYGYDSIKVVRAAPSQRLTGVWVQLHKKGVRAALCQWLKCMGASFFIKKTRLFGEIV